jgi:hypothetical protein
MSSQKKIALLLCIPFLLFFGSFQYLVQSQSDSVPEITLKWHKAYPDQNFKIVKLGLLWSLSYLGAELPKNVLDSAIRFKDSCTFNLRFDKLGFNAEAIKALTVICDSLKKGDEYKQNKSVDLSRFIVLTLYSPFHYYQITQAIPELRTFIKKYRLQKPEYFGVTNSTVSKSHRLIKFSKDSSSLSSIGFLAEEGDGSLIDNTFKAEVFETFDIMPNGQFRYAIYDKQGKLTDASSNKFSQAGSVGKCMWCHETYLQPLFTKNIPIQNMLSNAEFENKMARIQKQIDAYRKTLNTEIHFENKQDHTTAELLYISFMEPSAMRLIKEFDGDSLALDNVAKTNHHIYEEFPFLGKLYSRQEADKYSPIKCLQVPESVREKSIFQPNYFK